MSKPQPVAFDEALRKANTLGSESSVRSPRELKRAGLRSAFMLIVFCTSVSALAFGIDGAHRPTYAPGPLMLMVGGLTLLFFFACSMFLEVVKHPIHWIERVLKAEGMLTDADVFRSAVFGWACLQNMSSRAGRADWSQWRLFMQYADSPFWIWARRQRHGALPAEATRNSNPQRTMRVISALLPTESRWIADSWGRLSHLATRMERTGRGARSLDNVWQAWVTCLYRALWSHDPETWEGSLEWLTNELWEAETLCAKFEADAKRRRQPEWTVAGVVSAALVTIMVPLVAVGWIDIRWAAGVSIPLIGGAWLAAWNIRSARLRAEAEQSAAEISASKPQPRDQITQESRPNADDTSGGDDATDSTEQQRQQSEEAQ